MERTPRGKRVTMQDYVTHVISKVREAMDAGDIDKAIDLAFTICNNIEVFEKKTPVSMPEYVATYSKRYGVWSPNIKHTKKSENKQKKLVKRVKESIRNGTGAYSFFRIEHFYLRSYKYLPGCTKTQFILETEPTTLEGVE
jgi:hypothetical protein